MLRLTEHALVFACALAPTLGTASDALIHRVGYPFKRFHEKAVCGEERVQFTTKKSAVYYHAKITLQGFSEGACAEAGYTHFETKVVNSEHIFPLTPYYNVSYDIFSRNVTFTDVAMCIGRECSSELVTVAKSDYVADVVSSMNTSFGPCAPKAWACLGDEVCKAALECTPNVLEVCGPKVWKAITDEEERKKLQCIVGCKSSKWCVIKKCGKEALSCLVGTDKLCNDALKCVPKQFMACSGTAFHCVFDRNSECRDNLLCLTSGAAAVADPALNLLTDTSISGLMTCANKKCPAPDVHPRGMRMLDSTISARQISKTISAPSSLPKWPAQLGCMSAKCGFHVFELFKDKDIQEFATCAIPQFESCGDSLWSCLGDDSCKATLWCWLSGTAEEVRDVWHMVTNKTERAFLELLSSCVEGCAEKPNVLKKALCASKCGLKSTECAFDPTCRKMFEDLPHTVLKCGMDSLQAPVFREMASCYGSMLADCGRAGIALLRDQKLADLVNCNNKCTRRPGPHYEKKTIDLVV